MNYLSKNIIQNKKVILRCDFNVPISDNKISDDSKIVKSLKTINYLLDNNNTVIILSHFGRVKSEEDKEKNSLRIVYEYLKDEIDLEFIDNPLNLEAINNSLKKCFLVENTRYTDIPEKRESANDLELAKYWASFADIFVIDAFGSLHRAHSSTAGLANFLPTYIGFLVEEELNNLQPLIDISQRPFIVIMGGAKVDDKIKIIANLLKKCDKLILTGGILNTFLKVKGLNVGKSLVSNDNEVLKLVKDILDKYESKLYFSKYFIVDRGDYDIEVTLNEIEKDDIIYDNILDIKNFNNAKLVFFNGTCGKYEERCYSHGTESLLASLANLNANVIIGGGDTVGAVKKLGYTDKFKYLSSGGGATLEYVAYGKLKALEYINEKNVDN